ncbi:MAG: hypothetical protein ACOH5I_07965 [Oligoflexus sp.]
MSLRHFIIAGFCLFLLSCGKEKEDTTAFAPTIRLCDPDLNPSACPQNLLENSQFNRSFSLGEDTAGVEVRRPNPAKIAQTCLQKRALFLAAHLPANDPLGRGLFEGEFIQSSDAIIKSLERRCQSRNALKQCTEHVIYAQVACVYQVHSL